MNTIAETLILWHRPGPAWPWRRVARGTAAQIRAVERELLASAERPRPGNFATTPDGQLPRGASR